MVRMLFLYHMINSIVISLAGMPTYTESPCPIGHYCDPASEPELCPAGTMRPVVGAPSVYNCSLCREGYYCPNDTANVMGIPCNETFECPEGTPYPQICRPGLYCPELTGEGTSVWVDTTVLEELGRVSQIMNVCFLYTAPRVVTRQRCVHWVTRQQDILD